MTRQQKTWASWKPGDHDPHWIRFDFDGGDTLSAGVLEFAINAPSFMAPPGLAADILLRPIGDSAETKKAP